jgi:hypothetical protein
MLWLCIVGLPTRILALLALTLSPSCAKKLFNVSKYCCMFSKELLAMSPSPA